MKVPMKVKAACIVVFVFVLASTMLALASCEPIVESPLSGAPTSLCAEQSCETYEAGARARTQCINQRCAW